MPTKQEEYRFQRTKPHVKLKFNIFDLFKILF